MLYVFCSFLARCTSSLRLVLEDEGMVRAGLLFCMRNSGMLGVRGSNADESTSPAHFIPMSTWEGWDACSAVEIY